MNRRHPPRVLVVYAHPLGGSLNEALKEAVLRGVRRGTSDVRIHDLYAEGFDPLLRERAENNAREDTRRRQDDLRWADRLVFVAPLWWSGVPAILKGYLDRLFTEDFAFRYTPFGMPVGLLKIKRAYMLGTCDTPKPLLLVTGGRLGLDGIRRGVLKFCGIRSVSIHLFGSVYTSTPERRQAWLRRAEAIGERIGRPETVWQRLSATARLLVTAARLPLSSLVVASLLVGASYGAAHSAHFNGWGFAAALMVGLLAHVAVSYANEVADEAIDGANQNRTPFSGGTGLLSEGLLSARTLTAGWVTASLGAMLGATALVWSGITHWAFLAGLAFALALGLGYSLPPLRLSRHGLGEVAAFVAYGLPFMLMGLATQVPREALPPLAVRPDLPLLALPYSLAVFVLLSLTQIPDTEADRTHRKRSISVLLGERNVMAVGVAGSALCAGSYLLCTWLGAVPVGFGLLSVSYAVAFMALLLRDFDAYRRPAGRRMVNVLMAAASLPVVSSIIASVSLLAGR
jgi:1,4-dihydroxy-2-naphthoate polyprenyltransferase